MGNNDRHARLEFYIGAELERLLDGFHEHRSGRLKSIAERYAAIVDDELRRAGFSRAEWCAIFDVNNGAQIEVGGNAMVWQAAWVNVADSPELDEKWEVDHVVLARRVQAMSVAGRVAVWEAAVRFWAHADLSIDESLRYAGVLVDAARD